jgi:multiple sugar transport system permease protein
VAVLGVVGRLLGGGWVNRTPATIDHRQVIVFWASASLGDDIYTAIHRFEELNPQYKVQMSSSAARDITGDAQRLMCAVAGDVPPDVVYFDRFAIGEWASRGALTDLTPFLNKQKKDDPYRIDTSQYYPWAMREASYSPLGSDQKPKVYGIPQAADVRILYINSNAFRSAGIVDEKGNPVPPRTWDQLRADARKLTLFRVPGDKSSGIKRLGFGPNFGNSWLYLYAWEAGGEFLNSKPMTVNGVFYPPLTRVTMDSPANVRALKFMTSIYDDLGGYGQAQAFEQSVQRGAQDPFMLGTCAMKIDSDGFLPQIAVYQPGMDFMLAPAPMPADQLAKGRPPVAWSGGFSWVIPSTSPHKEAAFKFIQYLSSWDCISLMERGKRELDEAQGRMYVPEGQANRVFYERLLQSAVLDNPHIPETFKKAYEVVKKMYPLTYIRPVSPVGQLLWAQHVRAFEAGVNHQFRDEAQRTGQDEAAMALKAMQGDVQRQLDELRQPPPPNIVRWGPYLWVYGLLALLPIPLVYIFYKRRKKEYGYRAREVGAAMLFVSPWFIGFIVLVLGPIVFSIVYSFCSYDVLSPARYVGLHNYKLILHDPVFYHSLGNTAYMLIRIPLVMAVSLAIALLLNRSIVGMGAYRAAYYLPAIMPLVASALLWVWLFNPSHGGIDGALRWIFSTPPVHAIEATISRFTDQPFHFTAPMWIYSASWSKPSLILMNLWAAGGGMIIWLAGLQSIPSQLYEAASIDGAGRWKQFRNVTLPMLTPYTLFNLIIGIIGTMQIFSEAYIMTAGGPADSTLFYAYYLFKQAFQFFRMGYASALAWILFVLVLALTLLQLWLSKKWVHYEQA